MLLCLAFKYQIDRCDLQNLHIPSICHLYDPIRDSFDRYRLEISSLTSVFNLVTHRCNCSEDGYYYFKMDFVDDYGLFTDFNAYIIDAGGNEFKCELSDNLHEEQKIYVRTARGGKGKLIIEYLANGEKQVIELEIVI